MLLLRLACFFDPLAHIARVLAIESLGNSFFEGGAPGIIRDHPNPSHRLKEKPVSPRKIQDRCHEQNTQREL